MLSREYVVRRLINLLNFLKEQLEANKKVKNDCKINQVDRCDIDSKIDLDIKGVLIHQVVVDFISQVNVLLKSTWLKFGRLVLVKSDFYLKLVGQGLVKPLGIWIDVKTTIVGLKHYLHWCLKQCGWSWRIGPLKLTQ